MKILGVHNYYGSDAPSGENIAYDMEVALLRRRGNDVVEYTRTSDSLRQHPVVGQVLGAVSCSWNPFAVRSLRNMLLEERPDIMHVHNVFPRLSPGIMTAAAGISTAVVMTLHNYRIACASGTATRQGLTCRQCIDEVSVRPALRHRCYRDSLLATAPLATMIALHRWQGTLTNNVDAFIALTDFQRDILSGPGLLPRERIHVRPSFVQSDPVQVPWHERSDYVVFVGRLMADKGVNVLLKAWCAWGAQAPKLVLVGGGRESQALQRLARDQVRSGQIEFRGQQSAKATLDTVRNARMMVLPSMGFEGFPLVIHEAFASGVPVVASDVGGLRKIVADSGSGEVFTVGDENSLAAALKRLWPDDAMLQRMSEAAIRTYRSLYSEEVAYSRVMEIYEAAIAHRGAMVPAPA